jgi:hypothetical protein
LRERERSAGFEIRAKVRKASFTAREVGKISATSGSIKTTLVPSAYRDAVTPRVALEKSYSWRIGLSFFIGLCFRTCRLPRTDDPRFFIDFSIADNQPTGAPSNIKATVSPSQILDSADLSFIYREKEDREDGDLAS